MNAQIIIIIIIFSYLDLLTLYHLAEFKDDYVLAAEVGLLTRNIKIEGNDYDLLFDESYGARVLVGRFFQSGTQYKGKLCQEGYSTR